MTFEERPTSRKGELGATIVDGVLRAEGWIPYRPEPGKAHPFDRLMASPDKRRLCIVEVKSKPHREAYPDTGINKSNYDDYDHITRLYRIPLFLAFVDEREKKIYGNWWHILTQRRDPNDLTRYCGGCQGYPWHHGGQVYFQLAAMRDVALLTDAQCEALRRLRTTSWIPEVESV